MGLFDGSYGGQERSEGGTPLYRYGEGKERDLGPSTAPVEWVREREEYYCRQFGEIGQVIHEIYPLVPRVNIYVFPPNDERPCYTMITGGMSEHLMNTPDQVPMEDRRIELFMRLPDVKVSEGYSTRHSREIEGLRFLSTFPVEHNTWFGKLHTVPNGDPAEPVMTGSELTTALFMPPVFEVDEIENGITYSDGTRARILWVDFITTAECHYKLKHGGNALLDLFDKNRHPAVTDFARKSYV